jgi:O-antigen/teichoic acid export membrane protein
MGEIRKQGISNTFIAYFGIFIGFINVIFIQPNYLTTEELGLLRVLFSFAATIGMFLPLGIGNITLRYFPIFKNSENGHNGFLGLILAFTMIGTALVAIILAVIQPTITELYQKDSKLFSDFYYFVLPVSLFIALSALFTIYCQVNYKSILPSFLNDVALRLYNISVVLFYFWGYYNLKTMVMLYFSGYLAQSLILIFYIYQIDRPSLKINTSEFAKRNFKSILYFGLILSITSFASLGIKYLDVIMIAKFLPLSLAGVYSVAAFIPTIIEAPVGALERISNAKIATEWSKNNLVAIGKIYSESTKYLFLLGGFIFLLVIGSSNYLFKFLPHEYQNSNQVVNILCLSTLFNMATGLNGSIIINSSKYRYGSLFLLLMLVLSLTFNWFLIPKYGLIGAAIANASASFFYNLLKLIFIYSKFNLQPFDRKSLFNLMIILVSYLAVFFIPAIDNLYLGIFINSLCIVLLYAAGIYYFKLLSETDYTDVFKKIKGSFFRNDSRSI